MFNHEVLYLARTVSDNFSISFLDKFSLGSTIKIYFVESLGGGFQVEGLGGKVIGRGFIMVGVTGKLPSGKDGRFISFNGNVFLGQWLGLDGLMNILKDYGPKERGGRILGMKDSSVPFFPKLLENEAWQELIDSI
jgi:hypothetical protein